MNSIRLKEREKKIFFLFHTKIFLILEKNKEAVFIIYSKNSTLQLVVSILKINNWLLCLK